MYELNSYFCLCKDQKIELPVQPFNLRIKILIQVIAFLLIWQTGVAQTGDEEASALRVVFYNVENLYDAQDDTLTNDDEFLPQGMRAWHIKRFIKKTQDLGKTLLAIGEWEAPGIIGLCEVENKYVLTQLLKNSALGRLNYQIVHYDSPDSRGIDVAMLYRKEKIRILHSEPLRVVFPGPEARATRDILYAKGIALGADTLHIFINHWPSKFGGLMATEPLRYYTGAFLKTKADSIFRHDNSANIMMIGDFNDEPNEISMTQHLKARLDTLGIQSGELYNLMAPIYTRQNSGTHKFRENWSVIDQVVVSTSLIQNKGKLMVHPRGAQIFNADFLLEDDPVHTGKRPFRTYSGFTYTGGFADHLPIFVDIIRSK